jgi:predicted CoA-binding protein
LPKAKPGSTVAVLGASPKEDRFSFKAVRLLKQHGFVPIPVHPAGHTVDGVAGVSSLDKISSQVDTVSVYVNAHISDAEKDNILKLQPRRVVFNPGAENEKLANELENAGIEVVRHCTLVLLRSDLF